MLQGKQSSISISYGSREFIFASLADFPDHVSQAPSSATAAVLAGKKSACRLFCSILYIKRLCQHQQISRSILAVTNESQSCQRKISQELSRANQVQITLAQSENCPEPFADYSFSSRFRENPSMKTGARWEAAHLSADWVQLPNNLAVCHIIRIRYHIG